MRRLVGFLVVLVPSAALADPVSGTVVSATGRQVDGGRRIVTDVVVETRDGARHTFVEAGGTAGGIGQVSWPSPPIPEVGDQVAIKATPANVVEDLAITQASFVRTQTKAKKGLAWVSGCIFMTYEAAGTVDLAGDQEFTILDQALDNWNSASGGCSYMSMMSAGTKSVAPADQIGNDGVNLVVFRDDRWVRPASGDMEESPLPSGAAGLTTVTYIDDESSSKDGQILDADVELNGAEYAISAEGRTLGNQALCFADLENTVTHEFGHVLGLDHSCLAPGDDPKLDGDGNQVPLCSDATDPTITEATMYNFQNCGETKKSSPSPDDVDGVCDAYPKVNDPDNCEPVSTDPPGCCSTGGGGGASALLLTAAVLASACRRRRSA